MMVNAKLELKALKDHIGNREKGEPTETFCYIQLRSRTSATNG